MRQRKKVMMINEKSKITCMVIRKIKKLQEQKISYKTFEITDNKTHTFLVFVFLQKKCIIDLHECLCHFNTFSCMTQSVV